MGRPVGGKGKKAPYDTRVVRVPVPILPLVEWVIDRFYVELELDKPVTEDSKQTWGICHVEKGEAVSLATELVSQKKSASFTVSKLLQVLYLDKLISIRPSSANALSNKSSHSDSSTVA